MESQTLNYVAIALLVIALILKHYRLLQWRRRAETSIAMLTLATCDMRTIIERMVHIRNLFYQGKSWAEVRELVWVGTEDMIDLADKHINKGETNESVTMHEHAVPRKLHV